MDVMIGSPWLRTEVFPTMDVAGREHLVVATKSTWSLPSPGQRPRPLPAQPLNYTDRYYGEPGLSALLCSADLVRFKPRCDILFDAFAHSPNGKPCEMLLVQAQIGAWMKSLKVWGPRVWKRTLMDYAPSQPEPFLSMPLQLGLAFGGSHGDILNEFEVHPLNPEGIGWATKQLHGSPKGQPVPCLEAMDENIQSPYGNYTPIALNAIGTNHPERQKHAGTYDADWRENVFPFIPEDFDEHFHQSAPVDQRIDYPQGGEVVDLIHLLPDHAHLQFRLPPMNKLQVRILRKDYSIEIPQVHADTLFFETEARRFSVVWRASVPIRRRIQEFNTIAIGPIDEQLWRARSLGLDESGCTGCRPPIKQAA